VNVLFSLLVLCLYCQSVFSYDLVNNTVSDERSVTYSYQGKTLSKTIVFPKYHIPESLHRSLTEKQHTTTHHRQVQASLHNMPKRFELELDNVPFLNQGKNGDCTFFSTITAITATVHPINGLSPMCLVQLDKYLRPNPDSMRVDNVLTLIKQYGIVPLNTQKEIGCAGVYNFDPKQKISVPISPEEYQSKSEKFYKEQLSWRYLFDAFSGLINPNGRLPRIKEALLAGRYVVLEYIVLPEIGLYGYGADGTHHIQNDTWIRNDSIDEQMFDQLFTFDTQEEGDGHAIVVIGYDDDATAIDSEGNTHRGLLKLRNSWGNKIGDHGDFYMSYDYMRDYGLAAIQFCSNQQGNNLGCW
jgi:hypothetical protein